MRIQNMSLFPPISGLIKLIKIFIGITIVLVLLDAWLFYVYIPGWDPEFVSTSPDGRYSVSVYYNPGLIQMPPALTPRGNSGTVVLRDTKTGKVLQREVTGNVHSSGTPDVTWYPDGVSVTSVGGWDLPLEEP
jgi:DNA-binding beta-propeller fold protein YncE